MSSDAAITEAANEIIKRELLGAFVQGFGLSHQSLYLEFRKEFPDGSRPNDHKLALDTEITSNRNDIAEVRLSAVEQALLLFHSVNYRVVTSIQCDDQSNLAIEFDNGITIFFSGLPTDETCITPWIIGSRYLPVGEADYNIIAYRNKCLAIWDPGNSEISVTSQ